MSIDYNRIAPGYDQYRREGVDLGHPQMAERLKGRERILELGGGTGNLTLGLEKLGVRPDLLVVLEPAADMIRQARRKRAPGWWVQGAAPRLPFADGAFDAVVSAYVLHHIGEVETLFAETARVLTSDGVTVHITVPHGYIREHPLNRFFPRFAAIDLGRFPDEGRLREALERGGFEEVGLEEVSETPVAIDRGYLERVKHRFLSTFDLMSEAEFAAGVGALRAAVAAGGGDTGLRQIRRITIVWGKKRVRRGSMPGQSHET